MIAITLVSQKPLDSFLSENVVIAFLLTHYLILMYCLTSLRSSCLKEF